MSHETATVRVRPADASVALEAGATLQLTARPEQAARPGGLAALWLAHEGLALGATVLLVYVILYGSLLASARWLPFVMDNNETFASLWHGRHMAVQDPSRFEWLANEVFSPHPEAGPYAHTHQGNFPRLFTYLLHRLGVTSAEGQVVVTALTAGVASIALLYRFFLVVAGPRFAFVCALVFLTDYLFFAQWHLVTYRVWHALFLFLGLVCAQEVARGRRPWPWLALTSVCFAGLFYYELVFVAFVSILVGLYVIPLLWRRPARLVGFWAAQGIGGALALAVLIWQFAAYLGWDGFRHDLYLTYIARNFAVDPTQISFSPASTQSYFDFIGRLAATSPEFQAQLRDFYDERRAVFWWNLVDSKQLQTLRYFFGSMFVFVLQVYTPFLVLLTGLVLGGWLAGIGVRVAAERLAWGWLRRERFGVRVQLGSSLVRVRLLGEVGMTPVVFSSGNERFLRLARVGTVAGGYLVGWLFLLLTLFRDQAYLGLTPSSASFLRSSGGTVMLALFVASVGATFLVCRLVSGQWLGFGRLPLVRAWFGAAFLVALAVVIRGQSAAYDQDYAPVWYGLTQGGTPAILTRGALLAVVALVLTFVLRGDHAVIGREWSQRLGRLAPYLASAVLAYVAIYMLATGYVLSGYLVRYEPPLVFVTDVLVAMALVVGGAAVSRGAQQARLAGPALSAWLDAASVRRPRWSDAPGQTAFLRPMTTSLSAAGVGALVLAALLGTWVQVQRAYLTALPPTHFRFLQDLREPPFAGASFVVNSYSAPVAWQTQQWAYFDPLFGLDEVQIDEEQHVIRMRRDLSTYVWLADKATNPAYERPDFFVCMTPQSMRTALELITRPANPVGRCSQTPLVRRAMAPDRPYLRHQLVARDTSPRDSWAIVKLDWTVPDGWTMVYQTAHLSAGQGR